jgi:uncharacterized protein Smg (DUF494 family)
MHERIVEIIMFLVNELKANKQLNDIDVTFLSNSGYTQSEISTAFSWLFEHISAGQRMIPPTAHQVGSQRVLSEFEKSIINREAYGYLIQCKELGLLSNADVETIIDRMFAAGFSSVGVSEVKAFIGGVLFDADHQSSSGGGSLNLASDDTIH